MQGLAQMLTMNGTCTYLQAAAGQGVLPLARPVRRPLADVAPGEQTRFAFWQVLFVSPACVIPSCHLLHLVSCASGHPAHGHAREAPLTPLTARLLWRPATREACYDTTAACAGRNEVP